MRWRPTQRLLRPATKAEIEEWNEHIIQNPDGGNILQTRQFADIKQQQGWHTRFFVYQSPELDISILVLEKSIPLLGKIWYIPKGPGVTTANNITDIWDGARQYIHRHHLNVFVVRFEPTILRTTNAAQELQRAGLRQAPFVQANQSTIILPVQATPEQQLASLGRRARRYVRRAQREHTRIELVAPTQNNFTRMYNLMSTAFGGRGIPGLRKPAYYFHFWETMMNAGMGQLYFGFEDDQPTIGVFIVLLGDTAVYKDGGSASQRDAHGTAYLAHWHIMNELAKQGIANYDLWGSPPLDQLGNTEHPLWGIGNFKTAFSKDIIDYIGVWDGVLNATKYTLWRKIFYKIAKHVYRLRGGSFW